MRKSLYSIVVIVAVLIAANPGFSQEAKNTTLTSQNLTEESKQLDQQILSICKRIEDTIATYKLMTIKDIRLLPFQVSYTQGNDFIYLEKHFFINDDIIPNKIKLQKLKSIKIYTNGTTINKIESLIREENYYENSVTEVKIVDPSPNTVGTDDIVFTFVKNNKPIVNDKKLSEVKNTLAFPIQNQLKNEFYIPHLMYFYDVLLNISETYYKGIKDIDSTMTEFLKSSTKYY
jgi:hypothetical protein